MCIVVATIAYSASVVNWLLVVEGCGLELWVAHHQNSIFETFLVRCSRQCSCVQRCCCVLFKVQCKVSWTICTSTRKSSSQLPGTALNSECTNLYTVHMKVVLLLPSDQHCGMWHVTQMMAVLVPSLTLCGKYATFHVPKPTGPANRHPQQLQLIRCRDPTQ